MLNRNELKAAMARCGITQKELAERIGISAASMSARMHKGVFGADEAVAIVEVLKISNPSDIFFADSVTSQVTSAKECKYGEKEDA